MKMQRHNTTFRNFDKKLLSITLILTMLLALVTTIQPAETQTVAVFELLGVDPETAIVTPNGSVEILEGSDHFTLYFRFTAATGTGQFNILPTLYMGTTPIPGATVTAVYTRYGGQGQRYYWEGNITITGVTQLTVGNQIQFYENNINQPTFAPLYFGTLIEDRYLVRFLDWDNTVLLEQLALANTSATPPDNPTRVGYTFIGWAPPFNNITGNLTVIAQYAINNYTVTFDAAGGAPTPEPQQVSYGETVTRPPDPINSGYAFLGWYVNGTLWDFNNDTVSGNLTLTGKWGPIDYWINYDANGGTGTMPPTGVMFNAPTALAPNAFSRPRYAFLGWNTAADGSGAFYPDGATFTYLIAGNTTLFAQWEPLPSYNITYVLDGGVNPVGNPANYMSVDLPLAILDPSRAGFIFTGWTVVFSDGTPPITTPTTGVSIPEGTTGNITL
ncbi:MAG: InlB B-repeat-containing protein, partial [Nitrososphaerota archaeon]|nr:InlB B-repeat-containing protein [Nitrososphaerota archaeon]